MGIFGWIRFALTFFALKRAKKRVLIFYIKALQVLRHSLRALFLLLVFSQIFIVGLILTIYSAVQLMPADLDSKLYILLGFGVGFMGISVIAVLILTSDSLWFKLSGVQNHLREKI